MVRKCGEVKFGLDVSCAVEGADRRLCHFFFKWRDVLNAASDTLDFAIENTCRLKT